MNSLWRDCSGDCFTVEYEYCIYPIWAWRDWLHICAAHQSVSVLHVHMYACMHVYMYAYARAIVLYSYVLAGEPQMMSGPMYAALCVADLKEFVGCLWVYRIQLEEAHAWQAWLHMESGESPLDLSCVGCIDHSSASLAGTSAAILQSNILHLTVHVAKTSMLWAPEKVITPPYQCKFIATWYAVFPIT